MKKILWWARTFSSRTSAFQRQVNGNFCDVFQLQNEVQARTVSEEADETLPSAFFWKMLQQLQLSSETLESGDTLRHNNLHFKNRRKLPLYLPQRCRTPCPRITWWENLARPLIDEWWWIGRINQSIKKDKKKTKERNKEWYRARDKLCMCEENTVDVGRQREELMRSDKSWDSEKERKKGTKKQWLAQYDFRNSLRRLRYAKMDTRNLSHIKEEWNGERELRTKRSKSRKAGRIYSCTLVIGERSQSKFPWSLLPWFYQTDLRLAFYCDSYPLSFLALATRRPTVSLWIVISPMFPQQIFDNYCSDFVWRKWSPLKESRFRLATCITQLSRCRDKAKNCTHRGNGFHEKLPGRRSSPKTLVLVLKSARTLH